MPRSESFRAYGRRRVDLPVSVRTQHERMGRNAQLVDLGLGGGCLHIARAVRPGTELIVEIRTPTLWDPLTLEGAVAWSRWDAAQKIARVGVRFRHRTPSCLLALFELLGAHRFGA